jgi:hypothetical protein
MNNNNIVKGKKILVADFGLFVEHSLALAHAGAIVKYWTPWEGAFSKFEDFAAGYGYDDEGMEKVYYFDEHIDWCDMIFCPDVGMGSRMEYLRKTTNKPIFGSALRYEGGNRLEQDRWFMRSVQKKIGLPTQNSDQIKGVPALREYLKSHQNVFVKIDKFRADMESFQSKKYEEVELYLNEIESTLGPFSETIKFNAESFVEGIEPGFDCFFTNGDWVRPYLWGIEQSKACYLGKFVDQLPAPLQLVADKLKPVLASIDYRGALSIEARITKDGTPYLIDVCTRFPAPLSAVYTLAIENYPEVIWKVGAGEQVKIKTTGQYCGIVPLASSHAEKHYVKLDFPEDYRKYIKTRVSAKVKGKYYGVKGTNVVFVLCVAGNNWQKLIPALEALSKKVDTLFLSTDEISGIHRISDIIAKYKSYGMGEF